MRSKMKILIVKQSELEEVRANYPNSVFMPESFDQYLLGVHQETGSIIYNLYGVIHALIEEDYPELKDEVESDEWCDAYDEINERLFLSSVFYGLDALQESIEEFQNNGLMILATLTGDLNIINYDGDEKYLEVHCQESF